MSDDAKLQRADEMSNLCAFEAGVIEKSRAQICEWPHLEHQPTPANIKSKHVKAGIGQWSMPFFGDHIIWTGRCC